MVDSCIDLHFDFDDFSEFVDFDFGYDDAFVCTICEKICVAFTADVELKEDDVLPDVVVSTNKMVVASQPIFPFIM